MTVPCICSCSHILVDLRASQVPGVFCARRVDVNRAERVVNVLGFEVARKSTRMRAVKEIFAGSVTKAELESVLSTNLCYVLA